MWARVRRSTLPIPQERFIISPLYPVIMLESLVPAFSFAITNDSSWSRRVRSRNNIET